MNGLPTEVNGAVRGLLNAKTLGVVVAIAELGLNANVLGEGEAAGAGLLTLNGVEPPNVGTAG